MIEIQNLTKRFDSVTAVSRLNLTIDENQVFGLIGTNGAGKSTLLRLLSGVLKADEGNVLVEGMPVYDNPDVKKNICLIPDDPWFLPNTTSRDMGLYYQSVYRTFDAERFRQLLGDFRLDPDRRISGFSKGMRRQLAILLGVCANTQYLLLDEVFDGLDPVMRQAVKSLFAEAISDRKLTPVISSHNLRELEDICDRIGFLHEGRLLLSDSLDDLKLDILKIQCVTEREDDWAKVRGRLHILDESVRGRLHTLVVRGDEKEVRELFSDLSVTFFELLPLTLEEIFITETEAAGYDARKQILK